MVENEDTQLILDYYTCPKPKEKLELRNQIITNYYYLCKVIAEKRYNKNPIVPYDDIYGFAVEALIKAVEYFNPDKNKKDFKLYLYTKMNYLITDKIRVCNQQIKNIRNRTRFIQKHNITETELCKYKYKHYRTSVISFEDIGKDGGINYDCVESIADKSESEIDINSAKEHFLHILNMLTEAEKNVIYLYYYEDHLMADIANMVGKSEAWVSYTISDAIQKLKQYYIKPSFYRMMTG